MIEPQLLNEIIRQFKISLDNIVCKEMSVERRIRLDQMHRIIKDIDTAISVCGDPKLADYFVQQMQKAGPV